MPTTWAGLGNKINDLSSAGNVATASCAGLDPTARWCWWMAADLAGLAANGHLRARPDIEQIPVCWWNELKS
jgi:hypothetical protein